MLKLNLTPAPSWLDLAQGVRVKVEPIGSSLLAAANADTYAPAPDPAPLEEGEAGRPAPAGRNAGSDSVAFAKAVARRAITEWEGVMDEAGNALPVSAEYVDALMEQSPTCLREFRENYVNRAFLLVDEGNGSSPSPNGTSEEAPTTAEAAPDAAKPARKEKTSR